MCLWSTQNPWGGNFQQAEPGVECVTETIPEVLGMFDSLQLPTPSRMPVENPLCLCACVFAARLGSVFELACWLCVVVLCGVFPSPCCLILIKATENVNQQIFKLAISRFSLPSAIFPQQTTDMTTWSRQLTFGHCVFTCGRVLCERLLVCGWRN